MRLLSVNDRNTWNRDDRNTWNRELDMKEILNANDDIKMVFEYVAIIYQLRVYTTRNFIA